MTDALLWAAGNLLLPLFPVLSLAVVLKTVARPLSVHVVLEDGVLFFYSATLAAVLVMDLARHGLVASASALRISGVDLRLLYAASAVISVLLLLWSTFGFTIAALGRAGALDANGQPLDLRWFSTLSWISAAITATLCSLSRAVLGLF